MVELALSAVYHDEPLVVDFLREAGSIRTPAAPFEVQPPEMLCCFGRSRMCRDVVAATGMIPLGPDLSRRFLGTYFAICGCVANVGIAALCQARGDWMKGVMKSSRT